MGDRGTFQTGEIEAGQMAELLDVTPRKLRDLAERGLVVKAGRGRYDASRSIQIYVRHLRGIAGQHGGETEVALLSRERARLAGLQADEREMRNAQARGTLLDAGEVQREWAGILTTVRAGVLAVEGRVALALPHLDRSDLAAIAAELRTALEALAHDA